MPTISTFVTFIFCMFFTTVPVVANPAAGVICLPANYKAFFHERDYTESNYKNITLTNRQVGYRYNSLIVLSRNTDSSTYIRQLSESAKRLEGGDVLAAIHEQQSRDFFALVLRKGFGEKALERLAELKEYPDDGAESRSGALIKNRMIELGFPEEVTKYHNRYYHEMMSAWNKFASRTGRVEVFYPPLWESPRTTCGKYIDPVPGEFALFGGRVSPRVRGSLCEEVPTIVFDDDAAAGPGQQSRRSPGPTVKALATSSMRLGYPLKREYFFDYHNNGQFIDADILMIIMLIDAQCGKRPTEMNLIVQTQNTSIEALKKKHPVYESLFEGIIFGQQDGSYLEQTYLSEFGKSQIAKVNQRIAANKARARYRENFDTRFAIGATIAFGIMAGLEIFSPCHNDDPSDDVLLGCQ